MRFQAKLRGTGSADIAAYGSGDAEARLEKELTRALPGATLQIRALHRVDEAPRIVENFRIEYRLETSLVVEGTDEEIARRAAFAEARGALAGTRFQRVAWETARLTMA